MLSDEKLAQIINRNIMHYHPDAIDISIQELYSRSEVKNFGYVLA